MGGQERNKERYFTIPYFLWEEKYDELSVYAKLLYGLFSNRNSLSKKNKNQWTDSRGEIYFVFPMIEVRHCLQCSHNKAIQTVEELVTYGLISRRQEQRGKANRYYILKSG